MVTSKFHKFLILLPLTVALASCGGGNGDSGDSSNGNGGGNGSGTLSAFSPEQYLIGNDGSSGNISDGGQLWLTDGTEANTRKVKDVFPGDDADMREFTSVGDLLFFTAEDSSGNDRQLWVSDGSESGTLRLTENSTLKFARMLTNVNGLLHFYAVDSSTDLPALWSSDGTVAGTEQIVSTDISSDGIKLLTEFDDALFFSYHDSAGVGSELWRSDPNGDTALFADIQTGIGTGSLYTCPDRMVEMNGYLYFAANEGTSECGLWRTNGQIVGGNGQVEKVHHTSPDSVNYGPIRLAATDNKLFFLTRGFYGTPSVPSAIWVSDGTDQGTQRIFESNDDYQVLTGSSSEPTGILTAAGGYAYFYVRDLNRHNSNSVQLWYTDGTTAEMLVDLQNSVLGDYRVPSAVSGDRLFYIALRDDTSEDTITPNHGLWTAQGEQTKLLPTGIRTTGTRNTPMLPVADGQTLIFRSQGEVWRTDGTDGGTGFIKDICPGPCDGFIGPVRD